MTPWTSDLVFGCFGSPKDSEFIAAIGRAPMVNISRKIPPMPVAAPWNGSMKDGWVVAFHFEGNAEVVADVYDTRVFAGAADDLCACGGQGGKPFFRGFVRAVFVPHGREYAELCIGGRAVYGF